MHAQQRHPALKAVCARTPDEKHPELNNDINNNKTESSWIIAPFGRNIRAPMCRPPKFA